jgi:hypothetical protein
VTPPSPCGGDEAGSAEPTAPAPEIRAALLRLYLDPAVRCDPDHRAAMRAAISPDALRRIELAGAVEWLPLAWEVAMLRAVHGRGGDEAVRALARELGRAGLNVPIFRSLLQAVLGMLGRHRELLVRFLFASFDLSMRNAGRHCPVVGAGRVIQLAIEDIPAGSWDRTVGLRARGVIESLDLSGTAPRVAFEWNEGSARAVYTLTWP